MHFAKDKGSGVELSARKAVSGRDYSCPTCGEDVYVRGGIIRTRHFAHRSGRADPNCENYHPAFGIGDPLTAQGGFASKAGVHEVRIDPPMLGLRVEPGTSVAEDDRRRWRRWRLVLTLPKALTSHGRLRIPTGFGAQSKEVRLVSLCLGPQEIDVSPNTPRFGPEWISDEVDQTYRNAVSNHLDRLATDYAHAFVANAGNVKPLASSLVWGTSYYVIWKSPGFVIPEILSAHLLAVYEGWSAALVSLPTIPDQEIAKWLERAFRLRTQEARRQWGIVYPPPLDVDLDGNISVGETQSLVLGFLNTAEHEDRESLVFIHTTTTRCEFSTKPGSSTVVEVGRGGGDSREPLRVQWGSSLLPSIVAPQVSASSLHLPAVIVRIRDPQAGRDLRLLYHQPEARYALDRIRHGQAELIGISSPAWATGFLEQRGFHDQWRQVMVLNEKDDHARRGDMWSASPTQLLAIARALDDLSSDVRLSFGIFGRYLGLAVAPQATARTKLSLETRRRIIWYCQANGLHHARSKRPIALSTDKELLDTFDCTAPRPHLIAHRNLLKRRLQLERNERTGW